MFFLLFIAADCVRPAAEIDAAIELYGAAQEKIEHGQLVEGVRDLKVLGGKHTWFALAQWAIGEAAYKNNNHQAAYIGYDRYLTLEPAAPDRDAVKKRLSELEGVQPALKEFGDAKREATQARWAQAIELLESAIKKKPGFSIAYRLLGRARQETGDRAKATAALQKYLELDPDAPDRAEVAALLAK